MRGDAGVALPMPYPSLEAKTIRIYRSQLTLIMGQGGSGKSILAQNLIARMGVPALAVLLDQDRLTAASRLVATVTGDHFLSVRGRIDEYVAVMHEQLGHIRTCFKAEAIRDIEFQLDAYMQRYGEPPAVLLVDNLTNLCSGYDDEWALLRGLTLQLDEMAREYGMAVIGCTHTSDWDRYDPPPRKLLMGKVSQFPRLIISVGFNPLVDMSAGNYKLAAVKNSSGESDLNAVQPIAMMCNPATMQIIDKATVHPQAVAAMSASQIIEQARDLRAEAPKEYPELRPVSRDVMMGGY